MLQDIRLVFLVCCPLKLSFPLPLCFATTDYFLTFRKHTEYSKLYTTMPNSATDEPIHNSDLIATLRFSQQSPMILGQQTTSGISPLTGPVRNRPEDYGLMEQLFFSCLQTGDDKSAAMCLERLIQFFGPSNEKVMGLRGLYQEAIAVDRPALEKSLHEYDTVLSQNPANLVCAYIFTSPSLFPCVC